MAPPSKPDKPARLTMAEVIARGGISGGDGTTDPDPDGAAPLEILDAEAILALEPEQLRDLIAAAEAEIETLAEGGLSARRRRNELYEFRNACATALNEITASDGAEPTVVDVVEPAAPIEPPTPVEDTTGDATVEEPADPASEPDAPGDGGASDSGGDPADPGDPVIEGDPPVVEGEPEPELVGAAPAPITASVGTQMTGAHLTDGEFYDLIRNVWDNPAGGKLTIGAYDQVDTDEPRLGGSAVANDAILAPAGPESRTRLASICETPDIRREIPECGDDAEPVRAVFAQFPSDNMTVEYHVDDPLSAVAGGVGTWSAAERAAYDAAVTAGDADAILAAQKVCYLVECNTASLATALPVYACVEHTLETQYSHPQVIGSAERRVRRQLARQKEQVLLDFVRAEAFHFHIDAAAFGLTLGGTQSIIEAVKSAMGSVVVSERIDEANYTAIVPWGFPGIFDLDGATACNKGALDLTDFGVSRIVETKDTFTGGPDIFPPLVGAGAGNYYADWLAATRGAANAVDLVQFPQDSWWIALVDPSSWFYFSPFDFTITATRDDVHVRGNKTRSLFIEGAHGLARNGCQPALWLEFVNVCAAGVRAACTDPACDSAGS